MQVSRKLNDSVTVTANGDTQLDVFKELSGLTEVFAESTCKKCVGEKKNGNQISYRVREVADGKKTYVYPELVCNDCFAKFTFGQSEGGVLFPIRHLREEKEFVKDKDGKRVEKGTKGWVRFNKLTNKEE